MHYQLVASLIKITKFLMNDHYSLVKSNFKAHEIAF